MLPFPSRDGLIGLILPFLPDELKGLIQKNGQEDG